MLNIGSAAVLCMLWSLSAFPAMAKGERRVSWCTVYQVEGSFALQAGVPI
jgi:hypothetical protein